MDGIIDNLTSRKTPKKKKKGINRAATDLFNRINEIRRSQPDNLLALPYLFSFSRKTPAFQTTILGELYSVLCGTGVRLSERYSLRKLPW